ncbi:SDR family oxidoreductase [Flavobacterium sp. '19STA2R22 D10 B1']|uniref:SDR family oxidoreductase n=1 Tax=Flavobacterium aerium TaxID=3037261 RepID=UPI00278BED25|nr:SDR family NAD(P)-dependent oxidoreductase [Flavobacterium sp. '19STA2R22 D10 B1']
MNVEHKKIVITGGGSGIGLAMAKIFSEKGNQVIITGRNEEKLKKAIQTLKNTTYVVSDVSKEADVEQLVQKIKNEHQGIDILINNAGVLTPQGPDEGDDLLKNARYEMEVNYFSVVRLTQVLLPLLKESKEAAIVNVASVLSYLPLANVATYSASKAALHSYSQSLRTVLGQKGFSIKVFEVFPHFTETEMTEGLDIPMMSSEAVAQDVLEGLENDLYAIRNGQTKDIYQMMLKSPEDTLRLINQN